MVMGSLTPTQRVSAPEYKQHESVEFGELLEQYEHKLGRFESKPQLLGSFCTPGMQLALSESGGSAQLVKSARIRLRALGEFEPQRSGVAAIDSSLVAKAACIALVLSLLQHITRGDSYACVGAHRPRLVAREATWCYGILYNGVAKECGRVSSINIGGVCEVDATTA